MKIQVIKEHDFYPKGFHNVGSERGKYLIRIGVAVEAEEKVIEQKTEKKIVEPKTEKKVIEPDTDKKTIDIVGEMLDDVPLMEKYIKKTRKKRTKK